MNLSAKEQPTNESQINDIETQVYLAPPPELLRKPPRGATVTKDGLEVLRIVAGFTLCLVAIKAMPGGTVGTLCIAGLSAITIGGVLRSSVIEKMFATIASAVAAWRRSP